MSDQVVKSRRDNFTTGTRASYGRARVVCWLSHLSLGPGQYGEHKMKGDSQSSSSSSRQSDFSPWTNFRILAPGLLGLRAPCVWAPGEPAELEHPLGTIQVKWTVECEVHPVEI